MSDAAKTPDDHATGILPKYRNQQPLNTRVIAAVVLGGLVGWAFGIGLGYTLHDANQPPAAIHANTTVTNATAIDTAQHATVTIITGTGTDRVEGAGVSLTADGYILTSTTLAPGKDATIRVTTDDGTIRRGAYIAADPATGLAVIRVNTDTLTPVNFADLNQVNPGDKVITVGAENITLTGTVARLNEAVQTDRGENAPAGNWVPATRIDAGVTDPTRDGAPVFTSRGELLGITSITAYTGKSADNIGGFAINANVAYNVAADLIKHGKVTHARLGASITDPRQVDENASHTGALIADITTDSPAAKAGLRKGDLITGVNNTAVGSPAETVAQIKNTRPGERVSIQYTRDGKAKTAFATLSELEP